MKYAVVARYYDNGKVEAKIRLAKTGEKERFKRSEKYDEYVDIFETEKAARIFAEGCLKA